MIRLYRTPAEVEQGMDYLQRCAHDVVCYPQLKLLSENAILTLYERNCEVEYQQICFPKLESES